MSDNRLTKRIFQWDIISGKNSWCADMKQLLGELDMAGQYTDQQSVDLAAVRTQLVASEELKWGADMNSQPKLRTYRTFKTYFGTEDYVLLNLNRYQRSTLARLRSGILPLKIETGRYRQQPVEQRTCDMCNSGSVETESHFMFDCQLYLQFRIILYQYATRVCPDFTNLPSDEKCKALLCNKNIIRKTAHYVQNALDLRSSKIFLRRLPQVHDGRHT